jgi:integrase
MTLRAYILRWQEVYDKNQSRPTTYAAHGYLFKNHILPGLGEIPLSELTVEQMGDFLEERRRFGGHRPESPEYPGLGEHIMRHIHRLLQQCLDQAMRDGLITENPARAFHYPKPKKVSANVLTPAEVEDYLDAAERLGHLPMFLLALTAGLRQGELIALKWSDLDVKERTLTITEKRAVERRELVEYEGGTRIVNLTPETVELLCLEHAKHPGSPLMFMHPATQRPYSPQMVRRLHDEIIQEAGLDHIRFADLRHTCAVLSLQNGMDAKEVSQMLGHFRTAMTRQNYTSYLARPTAKDENKSAEAAQEELRRAADILNNLLKF